MSFFLTRTTQTFFFWFLTRKPMTLQGILDFDWTWPVYPSISTRFRGINRQVQPKNPWLLALKLFAYFSWRSILWLERIIENRFSILFYHFFLSSTVFFYVFFCALIFYGILDNNWKRNDLWWGLVWWAGGV